MNAQISAAIQSVRSLSSDNIRDRLTEIEAEESSLRLLLRATQARERTRREMEPKKSEIIVYLVMVDNIEGDAVHAAFLTRKEADEYLPIAVQHADGRRAFVNEILIGPPGYPQLV